MATKKMLTSIVLLVFVLSFFLTPVFAYQNKHAVYSFKSERCAYTASIEDQRSCIALPEPKAVSFKDWFLNGQLPIDEKNFFKFKEDNFMSEDETLESLVEINTWYFNRPNF